MSIMIKSVTVFLFAALCMAKLFAAIKLTENGKAAGSIYVAKTAIPAEKTAAKELQIFIEKISGARLPILNSKQNDTIIIVGQDADLTDINFRQLRPDEIILRTKNNRLYISGGRPRGTLYAAYEFLEQKLGIRFLTPDETFVPQKTTLEIEEQNLHYAPPFEIREILYSNKPNPAFAPRIRANGHWQTTPVEYGGHNSILGFCHTFDLLIPAEKYLKTHPEWFSLTGGKRIGGQNDGQLCLSNDEMRKELTCNALEMLRKNPDAKFISISQNDNNNYCRCEKCRAIDDKEGGPSGSLIRFVNLVAEDIEKEFPDVMIDTLAYTYTRKIPNNLRPRDNVMIRLCSIECNFNRPITDPANASFLKDLQGWSKITKQLGIWHYTANYTNHCIPHPNLTAIEKDLRLFADNKAMLIFIEGDHSGNRSGELCELRIWLLRNLLWDPSRNQKALTEEFLRLYYKEAAPEVEEYITLLEAEAQRREAVLGCFQPDTSSWLRLDTLLKSREILKKAEAKAANIPALKAKIAKLKFSSNIALLLRGEYAGFNKNRKQYPKVDMDEVLREIDQERPNWKSYAQGIRFTKEKFEQLKKQVMPLKKDGPIPDFCKNLKTTDWIELQETAFSLCPPIISDPLASDGKACEYKAVNNWKLQCPLPSDASAKDFRWDVYIAVRCNGNAANQDTVAFSAGVYNLKTKRIYRHRTGTFRQFMQSNYQWLNLGIIDLRDPAYVYMMNRPGTITYVDRIILLRTGCNSNSPADPAVPDSRKRLSTDQ